MNPLETLSRSRALWNRARFDIESDETLAQVLDRGSMNDWRALYVLAKADGRLRARIVSAVAHVPMYLPHFWLAVMDALGEQVDYSVVAHSDGMYE